MTSFKALIENSPDVTALVSSQGEVLYASASSAKVFGYLPEDLVGRNMFDLIHLEDRDPVGRAFQSVIDGPVSPLRIDARVCRKDWQWSSVESTISNLLDEPDVAAILVNYHEVGARSAATKAAVHEIAAPHTDFVDFASIEHDLREPLRTISMFADLLAREAHSSDRRQLTKLILEGVARMSALLDGLRSIAVPELDDLPQSCDLGHVMDDVLKTLAFAIKASDAIVTVDPLPEVQGNPNHLARVFQNLIANAIKYRNDPPIRIRVSAEALGPGWIIKVKDNGIGIAQEYHEYVFRLLKRLHGREIPGAGIGLAVCKKIVEASGGAIWVESNPEAGSTFCVTIPAAMEQSATAAASIGPGYVNGSLAKRAVDSSSMRAVAYRAG